MAALLQCDIVMKGGITSGVVYPRAMSRLSEVYRFRSIGGTSAGAIAAALTAAAEYRRAHPPAGSDPNSGFQELAGLPDWLAKNGNLVKLFHPDSKTSDLFWLCLSLLACKRRGWLLGPLGVAFGSLYGVLALVGIAFAFAGGVELVTHAPNLWTAIASSVAFVALIALALVVAVLALVLDLKNLPPTNFYGLCSGMSNGSKAEHPLTLWLANKIDDVAGKPLDNPLTFGDLRAAIDPTDNEPNVNLQMVTTCITYGRPYGLPFEDKFFYYCEDQFRKLFPGRIVDWMRDHPRPPSGKTQKDLATSRERHDFLKAEGFLPLPLPENLPVIVAARMSLSFPFLLSAVPLHAADLSQRAIQSIHQDRAKPKLHACWFSDGGLSSNLPIHLFDSPFPTRPTFAINLRGFDDVYIEHPGEPESEKVWMPEDNTDFVHVSRNAVTTVGGFFGALLDSMQNWNDNLQSHVPGFRDRVVQVFLNDKEGGLNLDMPEGVVTALALRGEAAADLLINHYSKPGPSRPEQFTDWQNHRWVRMRTSLAVLEDFFNALEQGYDSDTTPGILSYADLLRRDEKTPPLSYRFSNQQRENAPQAVEKLLELVRSWKQDVNFPVGAPQPNPELKVRPKP